MSPKGSIFCTKILYELFFFSILNMYSAVYNSFSFNTLVLQYYRLVKTEHPSRCIVKFKCSCSMVLILNIFVYDVRMIIDCKSVAIVREML